MPDIRLQALPQANILDQALAVGGESIYDLLDGNCLIRPTPVFAHRSNATLLHQGA